MNGWPHKGSFVLKFKPETDVNEGQFRGQIEHVASNETIRFDSVEDLLAFLYRVLREVNLEFERADTLAVDFPRAS